MYIRVVICTTYHVYAPVYSNTMYIGVCQMPARAMQRAYNIATVVNTTH